MTVDLEPIPDLAEATARPPAGVKITTPGEFAAAWNEHDQAGRQSMLTSILDAMDARLDCFLDDHVAKLQWWGHPMTAATLASEYARGKLAAEQDAAEIARVTAKAVLDRVRDERMNDVLLDEDIDALAREFGVSS